MALRDLGMPESGIDVAADLAMKNAYSNPRPLDRESVRKIIADAWSGYRP
jgi:alcohol dehydrogenase class IV